jgi:hypothetical protein
MNLEVLAKKLTDVANKIKADRGPLEFVGLFLRDDSPDLWDLVVAAPWLEADERESFEYLATQVRGSLADDELAELSRIVILEHEGAMLRFFLETFENQTGLADVHYVAEGGAIVRQVYVIMAHAIPSRPSRKPAKKPHPTKAS